MPSPPGPMPAPTTVSCERSCSRSRPRRTAVRKRSRLTSSDASIASAQSSIPRPARRAARRALRDLHDLGVRGLTNGLLARLGEEPVDLALRLREHLLALFDDPARLLDLLRDGRPHLVEDVVDLLAVDADLVGERDGLRVVHEVVELVDQNEDVHCGES